MIGHADRLLREVHGSKAVAAPAALPSNSSIPAGWAGAHVPVPSLEHGGGNPRTLARWPKGSVSYGV